LKSFLGAAKNRNSLHYKSIKAVYDLYSEWDCFEIHTPIVLNKTKLRKLFERYSPLEIIAKRSLYCIENWITGELREDYKFYNKWSLKIGKWQEYLSSLDFKSEKLKNFLFKKFPNKSNFEFIDIF
jgi:hypothetical protein